MRSMLSIERAATHIDASTVCADESGERVHSTKVTVEANTLSASLMRLQYIIIQHSVHLTSELLYNRTVAGATNTTIPAQRNLSDADTVLILHENSVMLVRKMELLEGVTKDKLRRLNGMVLDLNFKAGPAVKKLILKVLLDLHKDKRSRADKAKQSRTNSLQSHLARCRLA